MILMYLVIVTFDLARSRVEFDTLRAWVANEAMEKYRTLPGVACKAWFSDEAHRRWGAVYIVEERSDLRPDRLPRLADGHTGPIAAAPTSVQWFDLEAFVTGPEGVDDLGAEGLSLLAATARAAPDR